MGQQCNTCCLTGINGFLIPDGGLHLADMRLAKKQHAQSGLTDTAADGAGQLAFQKHSMVGQVSAVITACLSQLFIQSGCINTDTHGGNFQSVIQNSVIEQQIAV